MEWQSFGLKQPCKQRSQCILVVYCDTTGIQCGPNARCTFDRNRDHSICVCNRGFVGDGFECEKMDPKILEQGWAFINHSNVLYQMFNLKLLKVTKMMLFSIVGCYNTYGFCITYLEFKIVPTLYFVTINDLAIQKVLAY